MKYWLYSSSCTLHIAFIYFIPSSLYFLMPFLYLALLPILVLTGNHEFVSSLYLSSGLDILFCVFEIFYNKNLVEWGSMPLKS